MSSERPFRSILRVMRPNVSHGGKPAWRGAAFRAAACLACGVAATVVIAWSCAWIPLEGFLEPTRRDVSWKDASGNVYRLMEWNARLGAHRSHVVSYGKSNDADVPLIASAVPRAMLRGLDKVGEREILTSGWPMKAVWGAYDTPWQTTREVPNPLVEGTVGCFCFGASYNEERGVRGCLPMTPLFAGFAVNTVFYGWILWCGLAVIDRGRAWRRRSRGRCVRCGYALTGLASDVPCPECGCKVEVRRG